MAMDYLSSKRRKVSDCGFEAFGFSWVGMRALYMRDEAAVQVPL